MNKLTTKYIFKGRIVFAMLNIATLGLQNNKLGQSQRKAKTILLDENMQVTQGQGFHEGILKKIKFQSFGNLIKNRISW